MTDLNEQLRLILKTYLYRTKNTQQYLAIKALILQREAEVAKAYGGCRLCYGKGYSTNLETLIVGTDLFGEKPFDLTTTTIKYCTCDRGNALGNLIDKIENNVIRRTLVRPKLKKNAPLP